MPGFKEVLYICDNSGSSSSIHCYDVQLGVRLLSYKGGHGVASRSLNLSGRDFLIAAEVSKPFLHVWGFNREEQIKRIPMPGKVTALALSENGNFCTAAIEKKLYIWNMATGQLLNVISYHHEPITKIIYWNSNYFISCGGDGLIAVWRMVDVISKETGNNFHSGCINNSMPFYSSSRHSLPVTDMFLASSGSTSRLFTVSADQTCQIFSLDANTGRYLLTLTFDYVLTSVSTDRLQKILFVGTNCGKIILFPTESCPDRNVRHVGDENTLDGHTKAVRVLTLSREDNILASGSDDEKVILWNLLTRQQIGIYQMYGSITDLLFNFIERDFLTRNFAPKRIISNLERTIVTESENMEVRVLMENENDSAGSKDISTLNPIEEFYNPYFPGNFIFSSGSGKIFDQEQEHSRYVAEDYETRSNKFVDIFNEIDEIDEIDEEDEEEHADKIKKFKRLPSLDYNTLGNFKKEISKLKFMNRRLKKANKSLYVFAMEQIWQNRCVRNTQMTNDNVAKKNISST